MAVDVGLELLPQAASANDIKANGMTRTAIVRPSRNPGLRSDTGGG